MKTILKWIGIVVTLVIIALGAVYIYLPETHQAWVKPGIAQEEIPAGVDTSIVFENVTVIPLDSERVLEEQTVLIEDGHIVDIGSRGEIEIPAGAHVVDGRSKFLIPGLSDMHTHTFGSENDLLVYLTNGVTTIRILGADPPVILEWRDEIKDGTRVGPSISAWWPAFENNDFNWEWGEEFATQRGATIIHTPEEAERLVAEMAALGVDGIKSHAVISSEIYLALMGAAAKHGLPFDGHIPIELYSSSDLGTCDSSDCWNEFRIMGTPAIAHVEELIKAADRSEDSIRRASDESIHQIAQDVADDGIWITTTLYLFRSTIKEAADLEGTLAGMPEVKYVHPSIFDFRWAPGENIHVYLGNLPWYPEYLAAQEKMLLALYESGAPLMSGTDSALPVLVPGFSLHDELETMVDIGLSPYDVLKTSTYNPALFLGEQDEFGTIEVGKRADLVLLEANPLDDISNTQSIAGAMVRGRYFDRTDLDTILELVAQDYESVKTNQLIVRIAFPIVVVIILAGFIVPWVRRRKTSQVSS